jgi:hypothetical protein
LCKLAQVVRRDTRDTLANLPDDPSLREAELKTVGNKLALPLSVDKAALDGLLLKRSLLYNLDGRPLAQIAYLSPDDGPVAFCIIADNEVDRVQSFEERQGKNIGRKVATRSCSSATYRAPRWSRSRVRSLRALVRGLLTIGVTRYCVGRDAYSGDRLDPAHRREHGKTSGSSMRRMRIGCPRRPRVR